MNKLIFLLILLCASSAGAQITLNIDIKTGDDDLRPADFQKEPELVVVLRDRREIRKENISRGQVWPNNSTRRVAVELPEGVGLADLSELLLYRERGTSRRYVWDYLEKDNWTVKALKVTAVYRENGVSRSFQVLDLNSRGNVYRFVYDPTTRRGEGQLFRHSLLVTAGILPGVSRPGNATLVVTLGTGGDDLRGRGDNVSITLRLSGSPLTINLGNLNGGTRLADNSERTFTKEIPNSSLLNIDTISDVIVRHDGGAGSNDEWVLNKVKVLIKKTVLASGTPEPGFKDDVIEKTRLLVNQNYPSIHRFTSRSRQKSFSANANQTALRNATITAVFTTGDDDLRGGNDNVDLLIRFKRSRQMITVRNLNNRENWPNYSTRTVKKELLGSDDIDIDDIESVEMRHTGGSGTGADNWNLAGFKLTVTKDGRSRELVDQVRRLTYRFTGDSRTKVFLVE